jgi:hypothetical protein
VSGSMRAGIAAYAALWSATFLGAVAGRVIRDGPVVTAAPTRGVPVMVNASVTNARLIAAIALAGLLVQRVRAWRRPLDVTVTTLVALNTVAVGAAVGSGGRGVARELVHLPLEWAALAAAVVLYGLGRRGALTWSTAARCAAASAGLLLFAACAEAWGPTHG